MISLAVAAAGWVGVSSPGDYAAFKFPPLPRHDRLLGTVFLALLLLAGLTFPILILLAVSYGIDGRFIPMAACVVGFFGVFYVFEVLKERLLSCWAWK